MDAESCVKVAVRIRPLSKDDEKRDTSECVKTIPEKSQIKAGNDIFELSFTYDHVFGSDSEQSDLYEACVPDLVEAFFDGFNATILAYGQTGSGKTWTMGSSSDMHMSPETIGIIPRMIENLFVDVRKREADEPGSSYTIHVQFLEIYGEDIRDLLDVTKKSDVMIRETKEDGVYVTGAREELVTSFEQMMRLLEIGTRQRVTASTKKNAVSSRSHAIFTVMLAHTMPSTKGSDPAKRMREVLRSKFHFVDLAGSERAKRTGAEGQRMKEGIDINKGLLALGNVISALGDDSKRGKNTFVPYRDSKLTRILKDSLGGNSKTLMICCVSPASVNFNESLNALRYADRARSIKNKPVITRDPTLVMIDEFKHQLKVVSCELLEMRRMRAFVEVDNPVPMELLESWAGQPSTASEKDVDEALARIKNQIAGAVEGAVTPEVAHDDADVQGQELLRQLEIDLSSSTPPSRGFTKDDLSELEAMGGGEGLLSYNEGHLSSKEAAEATLAELRNELKQLGLDHELADEHVDEHVDEPTPEAATDAEIGNAATIATADAETAYAAETDNITDANTILDAVNATQADAVDAADAIDSINTVTDVTCLPPRGASEGDAPVEQGPEQGAEMEAAMEVVEAAIQAMEAEVESACAVGQAAVSEGEAAVSEEESADGAVSDVAQEQEQGGEQEQQEQQEVPDLDGANYIPPLNGALTLDETALPTVDIDADVDVDAPELTTPADTADSESLDGLDSIASASASASAKTDNVVDGDVDPQFALQAFDSMTSTPAPKVVSESKGEDKGAEDSGKGVYEKHVRRLMFILDQEQQARARVEDKLDRAMQQIVQQKEPKSKKNDTIKVFARSWFGKKEKKENKDELHNSTAQLSRREENAAQFDYNDREAALAETLEIAQDRIMEMVGEIDQISEANQIVLETKESVLRSLARQNTHLAIERDNLVKKVDELRGKAEKLTAQMKGAAEAQKYSEQMWKAHVSQVHALAHEHEKEEKDKEREKVQGVGTEHNPLHSPQLLHNPLKYAIKVLLDGATHPIGATPTAFRQAKTDVAVAPAAPQAAVSAVPATAPIPAPSPAAAPAAPTAVLLTAPVPASEPVPVEAVAAAPKAASTAAPVAAQAVTPAAAPVKAAAPVVAPTVAPAAAPGKAAVSAVSALPVLPQPPTTATTAAATTATAAVIAASSTTAAAATAAPTTPTDALPLPLPVISAVPAVSAVPSLSAASVVSPLSSQRKTFASNRPSPAPATLTAVPTTGGFTVDAATGALPQSNFTPTSSSPAAASAAVSAPASAPLRSPAAVSGRPFIIRMNNTTPPPNGLTSPTPIGAAALGSPAPFVFSGGGRIIRPTSGNLSVPFDSPLPLQPKPDGDSSSDSSDSDVE